MVLKGLLDLRAAQVQRDLEETEETQALLVHWVHEVNQDFQAQWDHRVHKALMDYLYLANLDDLDQRETLEPQACPVYKDLKGNGAHWVQLDQAEHGAHQERRDHLDPEVHQGPWETLETLAYRELLENLEMQENQETQVLLDLKERRERGETLRLKT